MRLDVARMFGDIAKSLMGVAVLDTSSRFGDLHRRVAWIVFYHEKYAAGADGSWGPDRMPIMSILVDLLSGKVQNTLMASDNWLV